MALTINNLANITYQYGTSTDRAVSNVAVTSLNENYSLIADKTSYNTNFRPTENLTYTIRIENTGVEPLYGVTVQDNLGGDTTRLLSYIENSAKMLRNNVLTEITPTSVNPLTMEIPSEFLPGEVVLFSYVAKVNGDIDRNISEITNVASVVGHENSVSGDAVTVIPSPSVTIPRADYASVSIQKSVDKENISVGEKLTYTFTLENSGNIAANNIVLTDNLPANFVIESITSKTNGVDTVFETTDYSIGENNRLVLPTSVTKTISVPESTELGNGLTIVTIVGTLNA